MSDNETSGLRRLGIDPNEPFNSKNPTHRAWLHAQIIGLVWTATLGLPSLFAFAWLDTPWDVIIGSAFIAAAAVYHIRGLHILIPGPLFQIGQIIIGFSGLLLLRFLGVL